MCGGEVAINQYGMMTMMYSITSSQHEQIILISLFVT